MGTNLHNIIDARKKGEVLLNNDIELEYEKQLLDDFDKKSTHAICFDIGEFDGWDGFKGDRGCFRFPYPVTWLEVNYNWFGSIDRVGFLCFEEHMPLAAIPAHQRRIYTDGGTPCQSILVWIKNKKTGFKWFLDGKMGRVNGDEGIQRYFMPCEKNKVNKFNEYLELINVFLTALNCTNIKKIENKPNARLQKKREKNGKCPIFSSWTLHLILPRKEKESASGLGTHESPRLHLRRGHPRQYRPGKWTWVAPCAVGNKKNGIISKDYEALPDMPDGNI